MATASSEFSALDKTINQYVDQKELPAFSIQIIGKDGPVWSGGYGSSTKDTVGDIGRSTIYRVGSISKLFTDIALMQLVEEGIVDLNAPVSLYLPTFAPDNPFNSDITVEALMSHRSGLVREPPIGNYFDANEPSVADVVESLNDTKLVYEPATKVQYSNAAVTVVGRIVEVMRGQPFNEVIQTRILQPLGVEGSFDQSDALNARMPEAYMRRYHDRPFPAPNFSLGISPAGNLYASMDDLGKFVWALLNNGQGAAGRILKANTLQQMWTPASGIHSARSREFGIGFVVETFHGEKSVGHGGAIYGFSSQLRLLPQSKLGVVASTNMDFTSGAVKRIADYALSYALAMQKGEPAPSFEVTRAIGPEVADALVGEYQSNTNRAAIRERHGNLYFERAGGLALQLMQGRNGIVIDGLMSYDNSVKITPQKIEAFGEVYQRYPSAKPNYDTAAFAPYFGEYGEDHNILYISEKYGKLHALIEWGTEYPLERVNEDVFKFPAYGLYPNEELRFHRSSENNLVESADLGGIIFERRSNAGVSNGVFQIDPQRPVDELLADALKAKPPVEDGEFVESDLVDVTKFADNIKLDIRYASDNNFLATPVYSQSKAYMQRKAALALGRISKRFAKLGYGLLIHDAYRPWYVTKVFWDATPEDKKIFVANPAHGSRHNRGCAIDITLYDLETGQPIEMVGLYDEMSERSYPHYPGGTSLQRWHRDLLKQEMERDGFKVYEYEWWHFDFDGWQQYPIGNKTFEQLENDK
ncbi:serine hydrolase [Kordiimonas sp.]|uniref:serine hydrolase n=1 Tax=Kordiimonas sp. TaxID=1970157 RepID=UPI003A92A6AF